jgi:hypothetical protein
VVDGSDLEGLFHVAPGAFDFEELFVAEGDLVGGQGVVAARQEELDVEASLGGDLGLVDPEATAPAGEVAAQHGMGEELAFGPVPGITEQISPDVDRRVIEDGLGV